jgi:hypothetical protein
VRASRRSTPPSTRTLQHVHSPRAQQPVIVALLSSLAPAALQAPAPGAPSRLLRQLRRELLGGPSGGGGGGGGAAAAEAAAAPPPVDRAAAAELVSRLLHTGLLEPGPALAQLAPLRQVWDALAPARGGGGGGGSGGWEPEGWGRPQLLVALELSELLLLGARPGQAQPGQRAACAPPAAGWALLAPGDQWAAARGLLAAERWLLGGLEEGRAPDYAAAAQA